VIFQDPAKALNPMMRIGRQVAEGIRLHMEMPRRDVRARVVDLLTRVQLRDAESLLRRYPHQLSGGQQQRVLIAIAIACDPKLLIADEPTTSLDVTVQNDILDLLCDLSASRNMSLLFVTHDLGVIEAVSQRVGVIYGGQLVELGPTAQVIDSPFHRYTEALIEANPGIAANDQLAEMVGKPLNTIRGSVPSPDKFPSGCRFRGRCVAETERCFHTPAIENLSGHVFRCWNPTEAALRARETRTSGGGDAHAAD
jgi:peptide/nickel transport system ATP-binding protein